MKTVGLFLICAGALGCTHTLSLAFPNSSPGKQYTCGPAAADGSPVCQPATQLDPSSENPNGTVFVTLPSDCKGGFNRIVLHDITTSTPKADVTCAPWENPIAP